MLRVKGFVVVWPVGSLSFLSLCLISLFLILSKPNPNPNPNPNRCVIFPGLILSRIVLACLVVLAYLGFRFCHVFCLGRCLGIFSRFCLCLVFCLASSYVVLYVVFLLSSWIFSLSVCPLLHLSK